MSFLNRKTNASVIADGEVTAFRLEQSQLNKLLQLESAIR